MSIDFKHELTRPLALIIAPFAALGWVLFGLSSWSSASVQKVQRLQIVELSEKNERVSADLARQLEASGDLAALQKKVAATREDLGRMVQAKGDAQAELTSAQTRLSSARRDLTDISRNVDSQAEKLSDLQTSATNTSLEAATPVVTRSGRRGRWSRRGRSSRSFLVRSR